MKKLPKNRIKFILIFLILFVCLIAPLLLAAANAEVIAPALQYSRKDYPAAFLTKDDYSIQLNTKRRYRLRCEDTITAVGIGDTDNLSAFENDEENEEKMLYEHSVPKDVIIKTKYETYTYMQIYSGESETPVTVMLSINARHKVPNLIRFGKCTMFEDTN